MITEGWHLKREIQVGHIITTLVVAFSVVLYIGKLEQRIALIEALSISQRDRDEQQDKAVGRQMGLVVKQLDRIDEKLDRLIERSPRSGLKP